jgi:hypothetical protein
VGGKVDQHLHDFGLKVVGLAASLDAVQLGLNLPIRDVEIALQPKNTSLTDDRRTLYPLLTSEIRPVSTSR